MVLQPRISKDKVITWSWTDDTGREISTLTKFRAKLSIGIYRFELRVSDLEGNSTSDFSANRSGLNAK